MQSAKTHGGWIHFILRSSKTEYEACVECLFSVKMFVILRRQLSIFKPGSKGFWNICLKLMLNFFTVDKITICVFDKPPS